MLPPSFGPPTSVPDTPVVGSKENSFSPNLSLGSGLYIRRKSGTKSPPPEKVQNPANFNYFSIYVTIFLLVKFNFLI